MIALSQLFLIKHEIWNSQSVVSSVATHRHYPSTIKNLKIQDDIVTLKNLKAFKAKIYKPKFLVLFFWLCLVLGKVLVSRTCHYFQILMFDFCLVVMGKVLVPRTRPFQSSLEWMGRLWITVRVAYSRELQSYKVNMHTSTTWPLCAIAAQFEQPSMGTITAPKIKHECCFIAGFNSNNFGSCQSSAWNTKHKL